MIEVLKQALEAFEAIPEEIEGWIPDKCTDAVIAIKQAIAELESQEPVACGTYQEVTDTMNALWAGTLEQVQIAEEMKNKKLYTAPPQRTEQEPVALPCCGYTNASAVKWNPLNGVVQCHNCGQNYTTSPQRTWVGLTDEESSLLLNQSDLLDMFENIGWYSAPKNGFKKNSATLIRAIEAKLKQKNGYAEEKNT